MTVIKINAITVPADSGDELAKRFAARAGAVDGQDGFEGFELLKPTDGRLVWLVVTRWRDEEAFEAWTSSASFGHGHRPAGAEGGEAPKPPVSTVAELWNYEVAGGSGLGGQLNLLAVNEAVRTFHLDWAWVVIVGNGVAGLWALAAHRWPQVRHRALWWFTAAAELAVFVQIVVGVILIQGRDKEPFQFHMLYGFSAAFAVAIVYSYRNQLKGNLYLLYGGGGLFIMGLGLRALEVGPH